MVKHREVSGQSEVSDPSPQSPACRHTRCDGHAACTSTPVHRAMPDALHQQALGGACLVLPISPIAASQPGCWVDAPLIRKGPRPPPIVRIHRSPRVLCFKLTIIWLSVGAGHIGTMQPACPETAYSRPPSLNGLLLHMHSPKSTRRY